MYTKRPFTVQGRQEATPLLDYTPARWGMFVVSLLAPTRPSRLPLGRPRVPGKRGR